MAINIEDFLSGLKENGLNTSKNVAITGNLTVTGTPAFTGNLAITGDPTVTGDMTITSGSITIATAGEGITWSGTGTSGGVLTNLYNDTASTLSGTQRDIKILIGTVPYYFTVYPTKA